MSENHVPQQSRSSQFGSAAPAPRTSHGQERLLTPGEVAQMFRVDPKTVTRWASAGRIGSIRTPGGHRRFRETEVVALLQELTMEARGY